MQSWKVLTLTELGQSCFLRGISFIEIELNQSSKEQQLVLHESPSNFNLYLVVGTHRCYVQLLLILKPRGNDGA